MLYGKLDGWYGLSKVFFGKLSVDGVAGYVDEVTATAFRAVFRQSPGFSPVNDPLAPFA